MAEQKLKEDKCLKVSRNKKSEKGPGCKLETVISYVFMHFHLSNIIVLLEMTEN